MLKARRCVREMREYHSPLSSPTIDLRLDMNESTTGCSPRVLARLNSMDAETLALYPRREPGERLVADFLDVAAEQVLLTNGADEGIDLVCRAYLEPGREFIVVTPAFAMYEVFAQAEDAKVVRVPCGPEFSFPTQQVIDAVTPQTRVIVICNPNNPTGVAASRSDILRVIDAAPESAILLDEAYFEFYGQTLMDQIGKLPNLFIARTFSKAYGLAGLRLGVLAGDREQISVLRRMVSPFNVNAFAMECLAEALADREFVSAYVAQVRAGREWLQKELEQLQFKCWPSQANFVLCRFGETKKAILEALRARGIALRDRPDCEGCVRITVGKPHEMERLIAELKQVLAQLSPATPGKARS
jgi:histidinol-phosphate aminotransferase